jgi:diacylglycerol kinase family enzyme
VQKVLLIANPYAGSVSRRVKEVIVKALASDFKIEVADTEARSHAIELSADAVDRDFDAVIALGGDGTINEVSQGLVGTDVALGILPGGTTNVMARSLGIPVDPVEATAFLSSHLRSATRRRIGVGRAGDRYFLFCAGMGLDAEVVKRVEADPSRKRERREMFFLTNALKAAATDYRGIDPMITLEAPGIEARKVVLAVCCNGRPFTYFRKWPVDVCPEARLDKQLDLLGLERIHATTIPRIAWGLLVSRSHVRWRRSVYLHDIVRATLTSDRPLPFQVDGDYVGEWESAELAHIPDALDLLA